MSSAFVPSGEQFEISWGAQRATIVEVGGGIRAYSDGERDVLQPFPLEAMCDAGHGAVLIPWPNRLADGRYSFDGQQYQLALSEPQASNAIHGLMRWRAWKALERRADAVTVSARLHPMSGYPFALEVRISYELSERGLEVATTARNAGVGPCPYACGQHPYLSPGEGRIDDCTLELAASTRILTDERKLPSAREPVAGSAYDFRTARHLGDMVIDSAFCDLARDASGLAAARLACPDGRTVELWVDQGYPLIELYTADELTPARRRRGLGVEPMSAPPNALQSGEAILVLEPGHEHTTRWGARLL